MALKVGDRVRIIGTIRGIGGGLAGLDGTIAFVRDLGAAQPILIRMDEAHGALHTGGGRVPHKTGAWVDENEVEVIPSFKFKVGDAVRIADETEFGPFGTVTEVDTSDSYLSYKVTADDDYSWFSEAELELDVTTGAFIVVKKQGDRLYPSTSPAIHTTRADAEKEAIRLAKQNHPHNFVVLQVVSEVINPVIPEPELKKVA